MKILTGLYVRVECALCCSKSYIVQWLLIMSMEEQDGSKSLESKFQQGVLDGLRDALLQTENDFLEMVENEMDERPDLVMVGSCVLVVLIYGQNLYTLNLGDSRAVLATHKSRDQPTEAQPAAGAPLMAVQLTELHGINVAVERERVVREHPDDPFVITGGRLKGKLRVTRAVGAGYLKKVSLVHGYLNLVTVCFALLNLPHE